MSVTIIYCIWNQGVEKGIPFDYVVEDVNNIALENIDLIVDLSEEFKTL